MCELRMDICEEKKHYPIFINNKDISDLKYELLEYIGRKNYVVVISEKVYKLYAKDLGFPQEKFFVLKDGEKQKNIKNYKKILDFLIKNNLSRQDYVIAIGGGVVGDIAGFCASTYMRGLNYIQVPTTVLAATDSSVGGKTAINSIIGKNLIGTFYQPCAVFINVNFFKTLDNRQFRSGLGEVIKYGFIEKSCCCSEDLNLINFLSENYTKILSRDILVLKELVQICVKLKISVVQADEKENNLRKILNYGHTYGHAVENFTRYKKHAHGECVVYGILFALNLSLFLGKIDKEYKFLCQDLIQKYGFIKIPKYDICKLVKIMKKDKKIVGDKINYVLPIDYGKVDVFELNFDIIQCCKI